MREYYIAESLKNRHTFAGKLGWIMPLTVVALSAMLTWDYFTIDCYNWWYTVLFPGMAAFLCGAVGNRDIGPSGRCRQSRGTYGTERSCTASAVWEQPCWCWEA